MRNIYSLITLLAIIIGILYFPKQTYPLKFKKIGKMIRNGERLEIVPYREQEDLKQTVCRSLYNIATLLINDRLDMDIGNFKLLIEYSKRKKDKQLNNILVMLHRFNNRVLDETTTLRTNSTNNILLEIYDYMKDNMCIEDVDYLLEDSSALLV